jgi:predicted GIY-YIG superfamily endonuclease
MSAQNMHIPRWPQAPIRPAESTLPLIDVWLYRYFDCDGRLLYVGITKNCERREAEHRIYSPWRKNAVNISYEWYGSLFTASIMERIAIEDERPLHNKAWKPKDAE